MSDRVLRAASAALALAGAAIAAYLLHARLTGATIACPTGGCETVQSSHYATVLGVPVPALALAGFVFLLGAALARSDLARAGGAAVALGALVFGGYLLVVQLAVVGALCAWCLATDGIVTALAGLTVLRLLPR